MSAQFTTGYRLKAGAVAQPEDESALTGPSGRQAGACGAVIMVTADPLFPAAMHWALRRLTSQVAVEAVATFADARRAIALCPDALLLLDGDPVDCPMAEVLRYARTALKGPLAWLAPSREAAFRATGSVGIQPIARTAALETIAADIHELMEQPAQDRRTPLKGGGAQANGIDPSEALTPAQVKVLMLMEKGQLNKQIAYALGIAESTVKAHVSAIFRKLKVQNRVQATLVAQRQIS